ncbi:MAG: NAD(P)H-dependent oxidoreductase [Burkholderiaceae bacterium]|jgi:multimeric flavodoxin WrbA
MTHRHFLFIVSSARIPGALGNTEWLAREAARHLPAGATSTWLHLNGLDLADFEDRRHDIGVYPMPTGDTVRLLDATLEASDLVFVSPLYWYSFPNRLKRYLDHWSAWMRIEGLDFKGRMSAKRVWTITTSGSREKTQPMFDSLKLCAQFLAMQWQAPLWGQGGAPGAVEKDVAAIAAAASYFGAQDGSPGVA